MKGIVIYHSQTGFTRRYAHWIAEASGADCLSLSEAKHRDLSGYDTIVFGGWACAGRISKISWFMKQLPAWKGKRLAAFCVGGSPVDHPDIQTFLADTAEQLSAGSVQVFYCPGGFNYEAMSPASRLAMKLFLRALRAKKDKTPQEEEMIRMIGSSYDISDRRFILPVLQAMGLEDGTEGLSACFSALSDWSVCKAGKAAGSRMRGSVKENQPDVHVMMLQKCLDGLYGGIQCLLVRIAVDAAGDQREGDGSASVFCCQRQAGAVAGSQQIFAFLRGLPAVDRSRGVDDVCGGEGKGRGDYSLSCLDGSQFVTGCLECFRPGCPEYGATDPAAHLQLRIGSVDDGIRGNLGDVAMDDFKRHGYVLSDGKGESLLNL